MKNLCVIFGGNSSEHDISVITGMQLAKNLKNKYKLEKIYLGLDNKFYLATKLEDVKDFYKKENLKLKEIFITNGAVYKKGTLFKKLFDIDCVINCCHGGVGEDGNLAGFFETNGIRYTSANCLSSQIAMDKTLAKTLVSSIVPTVKGVKVSKYNKEDLVNYIKENLSDNLIVKPNSLGSSIGVKACNKEDFENQIDAIFLMNDDALVEERVENMVEYNQACIKTKDGLILSAIESPLTKHNFLTFEDKYTGGGKGKDRTIPAPISPELEEQIINYTTAIYNRLNLNGVVRIDYIYNTATNTLYFNEVNTIPGSMAFYLFEPVGVDYITLIETLISNATQPKQYKYFNTNILKNKEI